MLIDRAHRASLKKLMGSGSIIGFAIGQSISLAMAQGVSDLFSPRFHTEAEAITPSRMVSTANARMSNLFRAHSQIRRELSDGHIRSLPSSGSYQDIDGRYRFLDVEVHLAENSYNIRYYINEWGNKPYTESLHGRYDIRTRICSDDELTEIGGVMVPGRGFEYTIITYMRLIPPMFQSPLEMMGMAHNADPRPRNTYAHSEPVLFLPARGSGQADMPTVQNFAGNEITVPDCITDTLTLDLGGPYVALYTKMRARNIRTSGIARRQFEDRPGECPPDEYPDRVVGIARYEREVFEMFKDLLDADGNNVLEEAGAFDPDWEYRSGCRALDTTTLTIDQTCERTIAGQLMEGTRVYRAPALEVMPEKGYYEEGEERRYLPIGTSDTWEVFLDLCDEDEDAPRLEMEESAQSQYYVAWECKFEDYPDAVFQEYSGGYYAYRKDREGTRYTYSFPGTDYNSWYVDVWDDWTETYNGCHRTDVTTSTETRISGCTEQERTVTTTTVSWQDGRASDVETSYSSWTTSAYICSSDSGDNTYSYDVDGDGVGDYINYWDAEDAGYTDGNMVEGGCGACDGPVNIFPRLKPGDFQEV